MKKDITALFYFADEFVKNYNEHVKEVAITDDQNPRKSTRVPGLAESEIVTVVLMFHISPSKNFKYFYKSYLQSYLLTSFI